ncbi:MAG: DUF4143 domain-containing protein, partial [Bacteroidales bacterium]|nr:DUF4143 domain-containing protein [Bacteroidales bacterium]
MLCGLQKYAVDSARKYNSIPKFQVYNNALRNAFLRKNFMQEAGDNEAWGRQIESAVGSHLINQCEEAGCRLFYWREKSMEVDFIIESQSSLIALEVKSGHRSMNAGLPTFKERFHPKQALIVGTGGFSLADFLSTKFTTVRRNFPTIEVEETLP